MTFVVAFDGSRLAKTALFRAAGYANLVDEALLAVTVVPRDAGYARDRGWIDDDEEFDASEVVSHLHRQVVDVAPSAGFDYEVIEPSPPTGKIARELRAMAKAHGASVVFVGSENAGRIVFPLSSVGGQVASDPGYDVHIVRREDPRVTRGSHRRPPRADFYLPG